MGRWVDGLVGWWVGGFGGLVGWWVGGLMDNKISLNTSKTELVIFCHPNKAESESACHMVVAPFWSACTPVILKSVCKEEGQNPHNT